MRDTALFGGGAMLLRRARRVARRNNDTETLAAIDKIESDEDGVHVFGAAAVDMASADDPTPHPIRDAIAAAIAYFVANPEKLIELIKMIAALFGG